jgi:ElaB/YqjD/DUF883 family membrane-anchored ribosome-binding protein
MKDNNDTPAMLPDQLRNDLRSLVAEAEKILGEDFSEGSRDVISNMRARLNGAQERLAEFYSDARKKVVDGARVTDETIRANPYQSVAIAAGIGLIVGLLVGRRRS